MTTLARALSPRQPTSPQAAGASFVMEHYAIIERYAGQLARKAKVEEGDVLNAGVVEIMERIGEFDPSKGSASTWIWWRLREVCTRETRGAGYGRLLRSPMTGQTSTRDGEAGDWDPMACVPAVRGSARQMEASADALLLFEQMTPEEFWAVQSQVEDWTGSEVYRALGVSPAGRRQRIYKLQDRLGIQPQA